MQGKDPETGRYLPGNRFWAMKSSFGVRPKFEAPDQLWAAAVEYFDWVEGNPLHEAKAFAYEGKVTVEALPKMRAMSISGLCLFLDISNEAWRGWRTPGHKLHRPELAEVIGQVEAVIWTQKFEGGAAELLNPNLVARDLGLADKKQLGNDPENPLPAQQVTIFALPDNGRG